MRLDGLGLLISQLICGIGLLVVLYAAWYEYAAKNPRDARLLAAVGAASLMGSTAAWLN